MRNADIATGNEPCSVSWCAALADLNGKCVAHLRHGAALHPQEYKRPRPERHWPPTPWDDEIPWYEPCR